MTTSLRPSVFEAGLPTLQYEFAEPPATVYPRIRVKALRNVMPRHLLDTRLNPSGELRDSAALRLAEATASSLIQIQH